MIILLQTYLVFVYFCTFEYFSVKGEYVYYFPFWMCCGAHQCTWGWRSLRLFLPGCWPNSQRRHHPSSPCFLVQVYHQASSCVWTCKNPRSARVNILCITVLQKRISHQIGSCSSNRIKSPAGSYDEHVVVGPDQTGWRVTAGWASDAHFISCCEGFISRLNWNSRNLWRKRRVIIHIIIKSVWSIIHWEI